MRTLKLLAVVILLSGVANTAFGQRGVRHGGGNYNPATETTVTGTIDDIKTMASPGRGGGGLHLVVAAATGTIEVHVGPAAFVAAKKVTFEKGDAVTIVGSKMMMAGHDVVIAREITKGDQVLTLRDAEGFPLWSGRGRSGS